MFGPLSGFSADFDRAAPNEIDRLLFIPLFEDDLVLFIGLELGISGQLFHLIIAHEHAEEGLRGPLQEQTVQHLLHTGFRIHQLQHKIPWNLD